MDDDESSLVSGEIETIIIKPETIDLLFDIDDPVWSEEKDSDPEFSNNNYDEYCFIVTASGEVVTINNEDDVQKPFYLESYFMESDRFRNKPPCILSEQQKVCEIDRITCYDCDIVFCNEHRLLEHLMTHIDVYKMGCNICDKDLNLDEKFQLHMMAVTWQSVYYCDFCRKSCAGVVRSKSQPPPPGKTYMCHDCEYKEKEESSDLQSSIYIHENMLNKYSSQEPPPEFRPPSSTPVLPPIPQVPSLLTSTPPPPTEVLQDHKQKPNSETKHEECEFYSTVNSVSEVQDCCVSRKSPPKTKENKKCRRPKPKVQVVSESMKQTLKMSTRSHTRDKNKMMRSYKCRYCPAAFTQHFILMAHLREKHKFHKLKYVCKLCGKEFVQQRCYENHVSFHQLAKNHMCFVCNLAFLSKYELEQHAQMHDRSEIINTYCEYASELMQEND